MWAQSMGEGEADQAWLASLARWLSEALFHPLNNRTKDAYFKVSRSLREAGMARAGHTVGPTFITLEMPRSIGPMMKDFVLFWKHQGTWVLCPQQVLTA